MTSIRIWIPALFLALTAVSPATFAQEISVTQLKNEIAATRARYQAATDGTERFEGQRLLADLELQLASRVADPEPSARRALTLYYDLLKLKRQPAIEADLLYRSAYAAELAGEVSSGIVSLTRLIENYPRDPIIPEAYFRRAEMRFVYGNYREAEQDYTFVLQRGSDTFKLQSLYKRGWAHYKQGNHQRALIDELEVLKQLLNPENIAPDGSLDVANLSRANQVLVEDALREMTLNFATLGPRLPPSSFATQMQAKPFEYLLTRALIDHYQEQGRFADAANIAFDFAQNQPGHPQAGALTVQAISALDDGGLDSRALEAKKTFVQRYGLTGISWNGQSPQEVPQVKAKLVEYLDYITRSTHATAQKNKDPIYTSDAINWYDNYLKIFPGSPRTAELNYLRADLLFDARRFAEAAQTYEKVAYDLPANQRAADAAYGAVYAWREATTQGTAGNDKVEQATLRFAENYPNHPQANAALAKLSEDLFTAGKLQQANAVSDKIIARQSGASSSQTQNAYRIRAAAALADNNYVAAEQAYRALLAGASASDAPALRESLASTIYKRGEALAKAGDDAAAATEFLRIQDAVPTRGEPASEIRAVALYDAAAASIRSGNKAQGAELLENFRDTYPENKLADKANSQLAALYLELGDNEKALREFNRLGSAAGADNATRREALLESAELYVKNGDYPSAISTYKNYVNDQNPPPAEAIEVQQRLVELYDTIGDNDKADFWRQRIIENHPEVNTERSKTLAARAALGLADRAQTAFANASLFPPLASSLKVKRARLQEALDAYGAAADYGISEVTTAATYHLGELYYAFSRALIESPRPDNLDAEEGARYEALLEEQAFPFEEEAIKLHQINADRQETAVKDQWVAKSLQRLSQLMPARYAKTERLGDGIVQLP